MIMEMDCDLNSPFFLCNMKEVLAHFGSMFEATAFTFPEDEDRRLAIEEFAVVYHLMNAVACDGVYRWLRTETLAKWRRRLERNGFRIWPIQENTVAEVEKFVLSECGAPSFSLRSADGAAQLLWKERPISSFSSWRVMR